VDPRVVGRDLLGERVAGAEPLEQGLGGDAAHGEGRRLASELAAAQAAVCVVDVEVEQPLIGVLCLFSFHAGPSFVDDAVLIGRGGISSRGRTSTS